MTDKTIVGVFLGGKQLIAGRVLNDKVIDSVRFRINNFESEEVVISEVISGIQKVFDPKTVIGIGIGVPSIVDVNKGIVYQTINIPSWREVHLKELLEDRFKVQVNVNNDANCFAVGEKYFGKAQKYENIVGLVLGAGLGAGILFNGHLYSGSNCGAGEIGYFPYHEHNFEYYLRDSYFEEKYGIKYDMLLERAKRNNKIALAIFEQYGFNLGNAIKTIMFAYDPECIIIGGPISKAYQFFKSAMFKKIKTFTYERALKKINIDVSDNPDIAVLGAAALYLDANNRILLK